MCFYIVAVSPQEIVLYELIFILYINSEIGYIIKNHNYRYFNALILELHRIKQISINL